MSTIATTTRHVWDASRTLQDRLEGMGVPVFHLDTSGEIRDEPRDPGLFGLWLRSDTLVRTISSQVMEWNTEESPGMCTPVPGLHLVPIVMRSSRQRLGYLVVCLLSPEIGFDPLFEIACEKALISKCATRRVVQPNAVWSVESARHFAQTLRWMAADLLLSTQNDVSERIYSDRLASAYETISVLYSIGQMMNRLREPEVFIQEVAHELCDATEFSWMTVVLDAGKTTITPSATGYYESGTTDCPPEVRRMGVQMLSEQHPSPDAIQILEEPPGLHPAMGAQVVVHTIHSGDKVIGRIMAGNKQGNDPQVSTYETLLIEAAAAFIGAFLDNTAMLETQQQTFLGTIQAMSHAIDAKDPYTRGHSERVAMMSERLALAIGMTPEQADRVRVSGLVHDVGKIGVPESVLTKPARLTDEEFELIKMHPEIGHRILQGIPSLEEALPGVLYHHERWDGKGYPCGIQGEEIPLIARIIGIADTFDAMSSTRAYRPRMPRDTVLDEIVKCAGAQFDPALASVFVTLDFSEYDAMIASSADGLDSIVTQQPSPDAKAA